MSPVPLPPDPDARPPARPATGRRGTSPPRLQVGDMVDVCAGALLVALPALTDPTFAGSVVFVLDHADTGTLGVVLGRPSAVAVHDVLPGWADLAVQPGVFHAGGPCETDTALCLATRTSRQPLAPGSGLRPVAEGVYLVDLDADPQALVGELTGLRVFAGYAGWSPGQLAGELAEGAWACVPGTAGDVVTSDAGPGLWRAVLARQTGRLAVLTSAPVDPTAN